MTRRNVGRQQAFNSVRRRRFILSKLLLELINQDINRELGGRDLAGGHVKLRLIPLLSSVFEGKCSNSSLQKNL